MRLDPFDGCQLKIDRGRRHVAELNTILVEFGERLHVSFQPIEGDPEHLILKFSEKPPPEIALILGDAVHNFRAALDIMICDIARLRGKSADKLKFPFADTRENYNGKLQGEIRRLGPDVLDALRSLDAFKGGNIGLRGLHDLDILDKHELVIPVIPAVWMRHDMAKTITDMLAKSRPGQTIPKIAYFGDYGPETRILEIEGSLLEVFIAEEMLQNLEQELGSITVLFADKLPFAREHVIPTLENLAQLVSEIVESFRDKFGGRDNKAPSAPL